MYFEKFIVFIIAVFYVLHWGESEEIIIEMWETCNEMLTWNVMSEI